MNWTISLKKAYLTIRSGKTHIIQSKVQCQETTTKRNR